VAGFSTVKAGIVLRRFLVGYVRSKPRCSSQSVTAASNAVSSTLAPLA
jgi:hypothetical protein